MMKQVSFLLVLLTLVCSGCNVSLPTTPTTASATQTSSLPTTLPNTPIPTQTSVSQTPNASAFPDPNAYTWQPIASHLQRLTDLQADGSGRLFVLEKNGRIRIIQNGQLSPNAFLDITDRVKDSGNEQGILGLAFHPDFSQNGYFYVNYTGQGGDTFLSRFQANGDKAESSTEVNLLHIKQPFPNHNGGSLAFGPDGYLYAGLGDGGSANDPLGNGQNTKTLLGKILRLDVNNGTPYAIPADNPFGSEVWAYGLRNPWRISFDRSTGDFYIGDVGQDIWEEIDYLPAGSPGGTNFGWNYFEASHHFAGQPSAKDHFTYPVAEYNHNDGGCSIIGGYFYRGTMPEWDGIYIYGDYCSGKVWGVIKSGDQWQNQLLFETHLQITAFGQDTKGEIYMLSDDGGVYQLIRK